MSSSKKPSFPEPGAAPMTSPPLSATQERAVVKPSQQPNTISSNAPQRLSAVVFGDEDVSAEVPRPPQLPPQWLDRLLDVAVQLPVQEGETEVVRIVVDLVAELLAPAAIGVCFVDGHDTQRVIRHGARVNEGTDPTRLFPGFAHEVIVDLPDFPGTTMHAASDDASALAASSPAARLLVRAASVLRSGLAHARLHVGVQVSQGEVHNLTSQMVQAEKLAQLGQIAAGMVHELNNPLTSIVAYTDYLTKRWVAKRDADPTGAAGDELERLRRIGESAHRLLRFTRDLVAYARPSSETPVPVVVHGVIDQALVFCDHVLSESRTTVDRQFGDGILPVRGLPEQLTQVFVNLVTNACQAMPAGGGRIAISTELVDGDQAVRIVVADSGEGIAQANLAQVFLPFFTTKVSGRGTGLGLSIVKSIVESHGGQIAVESQIAKGTTFTMTLPVAIR